MSGLKRLNWRFIAITFFAGALMLAPVQAASRLDTFILSSQALKGNVAGEMAEREVIVYLPPSYDSDLERRYPVVYLLHGMWAKPEAWFALADNAPRSQETMDALIKAGQAQEMILVAADNSTAQFGSWYTNSEINGDWETFMASELIDAVDANYRTLARRESRGLLGHSMGGIGAFTLAFGHPEQYAVSVPMSPASLFFKDFGFADTYEHYWKAQFEHYTGRYDDINYAYYNAYLTLIQALVPDVRNPPNFFPAALTVSQVERVAGYNLMDLAQNASDAAKQVQFFAEIGNREGEIFNEPVVSVFDELIESLQGRGLRVEKTIFDGGHTDQFDTRMPLALQKLSQHLAHK